MEDVLTTPNFSVHNLIYTREVNETVTSIVPGINMAGTSDNFTFFSNTSNNSNIFQQVPHTPNTVDKIADISMAFALFVIMFGMGCTIEVRKFVNHLKRPIGPAIGMFCQFVCLPLSMFGIAHAINLEPLYAIGMIVMASTPGGGLSNAFAYWLDGDVALSLSMTVLSNSLGFGMMPLNIWIYSRSWTTDTLRVPYKNILISLVMTVTPAAIGMLVRWKSEKIAHILTKIGSVVGGIAIIFNIVITFIRFPHVFSAPWKVYVCVWCLPISALSIGYTVPKILRMDNVYARTVAIETAMQNLPLCMGVISLSFPIELLSKLLIIPMLTGFGILGSCTVCVVVYKIYKKVTAVREQKEKMDEMKDDKEKSVELKLLSNGNV